MRPIDLVHLSRQSLGDRALEIELLTLFERQAEQIAARLATLLGQWRTALAPRSRPHVEGLGAGGRRDGGRGRRAGL